MFYSRQLLARKAPMGQIWMAATTHAKINRKKLDKLDIIKICEQILNPSVPMALRLSGILMGGVVIVYERKVKLLFDDVNRLLVELNQAWKVKSVTDPTVLPKGKSQAKYEAVTLPQVREEDIGETEQSFQCPRETTMMGFTETAYFAMRLDNMDDSYINQNPQEDPPQDYHQANTADITLFDCFDPSLADTSMYNRLERFDIEGDEDTQFNSTAQERTAIPSALIPSPPPEDKPQEADEILEQYPQDQVYQQAANGKENLQGQFRQGPTRRRARRPAALAMDNNQTIIPGEIYQSWLNGTSDITSRTRKKKHTDAMSKRKIADLMELPPTVLFDRLFTYGNKEVHYPGPLLELWIKSTQPLHDSPSGTTSTPPKPSSTSPPEGIHDQDPHGYPFEDFHSGVGPQNLGVVDSLEKLRINQKKNNLPSSIRDAINAGVPHGGSFSMTNLMATPGNSSDEVRSIPSSGSGHGLLSHNSDINSARSNKKRPNSSSRDQGNGLEPVAEEKSGQSPERILKWARLSENGLLPENELMVETGPTQSQQHPLTSQATDQITRSIQMHLKAHFETPGSSKTESLNELATGMDKKKAASLFYQTCVLATIDVIKVQQRSPYGDILISRGAKM